MEVSGQLHAPAALPPKKRDPGTHWIGGQVGPRTVLDAVVKRTSPSPRRESNPIQIFFVLLFLFYAAFETAARNAIADTFVSRIVGTTVCGVEASGHSRCGSVKQATLKCFPTCTHYTHTHTHTHTVNRNPSTVNRWSVLNEETCKWSTCWNTHTLIGAFSFRTHNVQYVFTIHLNRHRQTDRQTDRQVSRVVNNKGRVWKVPGSLRLEQRWEEREREIMFCAWLVCGSHCLLVGGRGNTKTDRF
jgi:hypothetical protein